MNIVELLKKSAEKFPRRTAVIFEKEKLNYRRLMQKVDELAACLRDELNLSPQDKVALLLGNSHFYVISFFAVSAAGGVVVPLNTFLKPEELIYILDDSRTKLLITSADFLRSQEWQKSVSVTTTLKSFLAGAGELKQILLVDEKLEGFLFLGDLLKKRAEGKEKPGTDEEDTALIIYTSGTTGRPKGVELTHKNLVSNVQVSLSAIRIERRDRFLVILPMFHAFTITVCMLIPLSVGGGMVILGSVRPFRRVIRSLVLNRVSIMVGIPQLFKVLKGVNVPRIFLFLLRVRLCVSGAAALGKEVASEFKQKFRIPLLEGYGLTEASPVVSINPLEGEQRAGSVGLPLDGVEVKVVDEEEKELPRGEAGELIVRGANVMKGYYRRPEETERTIKNGWLLTGDMARIDEDGYIYIVDRKKDLIIVHGLNIYPREIEDVIAQLPEVKQVAVIGRPDRSRGEVPVAIISREEGSVLAERDVRDFCKRKLAAYKVPHHIIFRDQLPLTPTGKVLKRELKKELGY